MTNEEAMAPMLLVQNFVERLPSGNTGVALVNFHGIRCLVLDAEGQVLYTAAVDGHQRPEVVAFLLKAVWGM